MQRNVLWQNLSLGFLIGSTVFAIVCFVSPYWSELNGHRTHNGLWVTCVSLNENDKYCGEAYATGTVHATRFFTAVSLILQGVSIFVFVIEKTNFYERSLTSSLLIISTCFGAGFTLMIALFVYGTATCGIVRYTNVENWNLCPNLSWAFYLDIPVFFAIISAGVFSFLKLRMESNWKIGPLLKRKEKGKNDFATNKPKKNTKKSSKGKKDTSKQGKGNSNSGSKNKVQATTSKVVNEKKTGGKSKSTK